MNRARARRENIAAYALLSPQLAGYLLFVLFPLVFSIYLCFSYWNMVDMPVFIGFKNFEALFRDDIFWKSMGRMEKVRSSYRQN